MEAVTKELVPEVEEGIDEPDFPVFAALPAMMVTSAPYADRHLGKKELLTCFSRWD